MGLYLALGIMIPIRLGTVAILQMMVAGGLVNTLSALILVYTAQGLPLAVFILAEFMKGVSDDLKNAGRIDGLSEYRIFFSLVLPLVRPAMATVAVFTMIAVNWHRYVLLNEPVGWLPQVRMDRILAYFGTALLVGIITFVVATVIVLVAGALGAIGWLIGIPLFVVVFALSLRLSTALPGAALGQGGGLSGSMAATTGATGTLIALTLIYFGASILVGIVVGLLSMIPLLGVLINLGFQWIAMLVGLSILTTLYGHYVEKRTLA